MVLNRWKWDLAEIGLCILWIVLNGITAGLISALSSLHPLKLRLLNDQQIQGSLESIYKSRQSLVIALTILNGVTTAALTLEIRQWVPYYLTVFLTSFLIIFFGRVLPQGFFHRHRIGMIRVFWPLLKIIRIILFIIVWPLNQIMICTMGDLETTDVLFTREELKALVDEQMRSHLVEEDEAAILIAALDFSRKKVHEIQVPIEEVEMLPLDSVMDFMTMATIMGLGFSRIPVFDGARDNIVGVLLVKKIIIFDPEDERPLSQLHLPQPLFMSEERSLMEALNIFQEQRKHFAFVLTESGEITGIITLEDIFEEIIQEEIEDEFDGHKSLSSPRSSLPSSPDREKAAKTAAKLKQILSKNNSSRYDNEDDMKKPLLMDISED